MPYEMLTGRRALGGKANCVSKTREIGTSPFEWRTWSIVLKNHSGPGTQSRLEFVGIERLDQVIVGAGFEAGNDVLL